jgi:hypothetical protein
LDRDILFHSSLDICYKWYFTNPTLYIFVEWPRYWTYLNDTCYYKSWSSLIVNLEYLFIIHFSDVTLLFEKWIIFKNLQFIHLFLNIWTLTFYCFRLRNVTNICWDFRVSNHCRAFWHSILPSNNSVTVTTLLYSIISIYDSW